MGLQSVEEKEKIENSTKISSEWDNQRSFISTNDVIEN